ncbi:MAG: DUF2799 domain-containing protein [Natronohydrobacter sp.]|nr:DUF2799 domain-containing protein [Natronohydrobacter sp.]
MRPLPLALAALTLLSACASVSREECLAGDWVSIGQRDGAAGRVGSAQFERHVTACAKVDVTPDRTAWAQGYEVGLRQYCTPLSGLREGEAGHSYRNVCPAATEAGFLRGHDLGLAAYRQRQRISEIEREISELTRRNAAIAGKEEQLAEWQANQSQILSLRLDLGFARAELSRIEREIRAFRAAQ